jgi:hypothetical protein
LFDVIREILGFGESGIANHDHKSASMGIPSPAEQFPCLAEAEPVRGSVNLDLTGA